MTQPPTTQDWSILGIDPTSDATIVRRAYRTRLRDVGPEADPDGFQALRAAYEAILASVSDTPRPTVGSADGEQNDALVGTFINGLHARRIAGDEAAAIALVDQTLAAYGPGSAMTDAIDDVLFEQLALSRNVSPGLFRHVVDRLDWRDAQGRPARSDPERHAFVLDRIAAEDWYHDLAMSCGDPTRWIETAFIGPEEDTRVALHTEPFVVAQRQDIRTLFEQLLSHATFVLTRFDGGTLALLRQVVEGEPLVAGAAVARPAPAFSPAAAAASPATRKWTRRRIVLVALAVIILGPMIVPILQILVSPFVASIGLKDTALPASVALPMLKDPKTVWVDLVPGPDGVRVDWAPVMRMRHAIKELHVGYNDQGPDTLFPLPQNDAPIGFLAPPSITAIVMRIRYGDGTWSEVRRYPITKASRR